MSIGTPRFWLALVTLLFFSWSGNESFARHIVGGEVTYQCIGEPSPGERTYEIFFTLYRDAEGNGALFDSDFGSGITFQYTIYRGPQQTFIDTIDIQGGNLDIENYPENDPGPCAPVAPPINFEVGYYRSTITLPVSTETYTITYQRCCRNEAIGNIVNPGEAGATYFVEITPTAQQSCNNSPEFRSLAPLLLCADNLLVFDASATDAEGDNLTYSICDPVLGGGNDTRRVRTPLGVAPSPETRPPYTDVTFSPGFSATNPFPANPPFTLNPTTGELRVQPTQVGTFLVCISVEERRSGELISVVRRDFQFQVVECEAGIQANLDSPAQADSIDFDPQFDRAFIQFCGTTDISLFNTSTPRGLIRDIEWQVPDAVGGPLVSREDVLQVSFPDYGVYPARLLVNPGGQCEDSLDVRVRVTPPTSPGFSFTYDTCEYGPVTFTNLSTTQADSILGYRWDFGRNESSIEAEPEFLFASAGNRIVELTAIDNFGCEYADTQVIPFFPVPTELDAFFEGNRVCAPALVPFRQGTGLLTDEYDVLWDFGNGLTSTELEPNFAFTEPGVFNVYFRAISPLGCFVDTQLTAALEVLVSPDADFTVDQPQRDIRDPEFQFTDTSIDAVSWQWLFDSVGTSREEDPIFEFPDTGTYKVDLIVSNLNACFDTTTQFVRIDPFDTYFLGNAFTPNGDGVNEVFVGAGFVDFLENFRMRIYNRWGELVFETGDPREGWDGRIKRNGNNGLPGVYLYIVDYDDPDGDSQQLTGYVTLVR